MKVLLETDAVGGVWTFSLSLAVALRERGVEARLAQVGPGDADRWAEAERCNVPVQHLGGPLEWQPGLAGSEALRRQGVELGQAAQESGADALLTCTYAHAGRLASGGDDACGLPVVHTAHSDVLSWWRAAHRSRPPAVYDAYARGLRAAVSRADAVVVPTRAYGRAFGAVVGDARPFRVILNGIRTEEQPAARVARRGVLAAARFGDATKNASVLARAARRLGDGLRLAGAGSEEAVARFGGGVALGTLGPDAVEAEMRTAAVFAGPARLEPFGLAVLEAAAAGCALVLADQPTHRELWDGAADFVDPDDPDAWADALERRLADPTAAGEAARERSRRYGIDRTAGAYASLFEEVRAAAAERSGPRIWRATA